MNQLSHTAKPVFRLVQRGLAYASRLTIACHNMGAADAMRALALGRRRRRPTSVHLRGIDRDFKFRGCEDFGVLSHFFTPGFRIADTPEQRVARIIDAGANIGDETLRFRYAHPDAEIVALEADPDNFCLLKENVRGGVAQARHLALWKHCGELALERDLNSHESPRVQETPGSSVRVRATTIDEIMADMGWDSVDILKLDIEGAEAAVFEGDTERWLPHVRTIIMECPDNDAPGTTHEIFDTLTRLGIRMRCYIQGESLVLIRSDTDWRVVSQLWY